MGVTFSQFFPPTAGLTEANLPSQEGKVFVITGGASGVGFELASILYQAGAKVYIAGRSETNAKDSIAKLQSRTLASRTQKVGSLEFLPLDLNDFNSVKAAVKIFKSKESKLDVLWNNAGVSLPPLGSKSEQGYELQMATNCLGPFLLTRLLLPLLEAAAKHAPEGTVRVVWTSSQIVDLSPSLPEKIMSDVITPPTDKQRNYLLTKIGNWFLANELAREVGKSGIISVCQNPGNLKTQLMRHAMWMAYAVYAITYPAKQGAYTELWAGLSTELTMKDNGGYVIPWGRVHPAPNEELLKEIGRRENGEGGVAKQFWDWCEEQTEKYV
jgi:NAD(P)-dependent dehydrogenase (short-subunit alcohol dehydrogenase family)